MVGEAVVGAYVGPGVGLSVGGLVGWNGIWEQTHKRMLDYVPIIMAVFQLILNTVLGTSSCSVD